MLLTQGQEAPPAEPLDSCATHRPILSGGIGVLLFGENPNHEAPSDAFPFSASVGVLQRRGQPPRAKVT